MTPKKGSKRRGTAALWVVGLAVPVAGLYAGVTNYTYDELGRLVRVSDTRNGDRVYAYDPAGNRTQVIVGGTEQQPPSSEPRERDPRPGSRRAAVDGSPEMLNFGEDLRTPLASLEGLSSPAIDSKVSEPEPRPVNVR
jgi:YD repeat-containing protein